MKYVRLLEEKDLIETKRTIVERHDGVLRNGNLMYRIEKSINHPQHEKGEKTPVII